MKKEQVTAEELFIQCHLASYNAGWWHDPVTGKELITNAYVVPSKLMLIVSEIAEGMEGYRKDLKDDKLPHREMLEVELADAVIRIADLAGMLEYDLTEAIMEKLSYNATRPDHKKDNRQGVGGKKF